MMVQVPGELDPEGGRGRVGEGHAWTDPSLRAGRGGYSWGGRGRVGEGHVWPLKLCLQVQVKMVQETNTANMDSHIGMNNCC